MKNFLILVLLMPIVSEAMHHKSEPIIFYLDMEVAEGKGDGIESFISYLSKTVKKTEPIPCITNTGYHQIRKKFL